MIPLQSCSTAKHHELEWARRERAAVAWDPAAASDVNQWLQCLPQKRPVTIQATVASLGVVGVCVNGRHWHPGIADINAAGSVEASNCSKVNNTAGSPEVIGVWR